MLDVQSTDTTFDQRELDRLLDRAKTHVFMGKNAAFLGALMCYMEFEWSTKTKTASTNGVKVWWNPHFFINLKPRTRETVLMHELWHGALLHLPRMIGRDPKVWNYACDIVINNGLEDDGYSFEGIEWCWKDQQYRGMSAEEVYDKLMENAIQVPVGGSWGSGNQGQPGDEDGDLEAPSSPSQIQQAVGNVVQATHAARASNQAGSIPGEVEKILTQFLAPIIPWEVALHRFMTDLLELDYDWRTKDRRFPRIYLPGMVEDEGRLEHLLYVWDVSGSITDAQEVRMNSEVAYIHRTFKPKKLTLIQFDTRITDVQVFEEDDEFNGVKIIGKGGTDLRPVRQFILDHEPTAVIIFSDLYVEPMVPLDNPPPMIWVAIDNKSAVVPHGEIIHIKG